MTVRKFKPKGDCTTTLPEPYYDLVRVLAGKTKASTAEIVRFIICTYIREVYPTFAEYHFDPIPGPGPKRT